MVNTQERSNKSANVNEIEQLKGSSNSTGSVGSSSSSPSSSSLSSSSSSSLSNVGASSLSQSQPSSSAAPVKSAYTNPNTTSANFAKNASAHAVTAAAQSHHKLIPIQSVLNTNSVAADPQQQQQSQQQQQQQQHLHHNNHNTTYHSSAYNHHSSSNNLQFPQSGSGDGGATHLNVPNTTLQNFLSGAATHSQLPTELPHEDEERLGNLFKQLDRDGNGRIDIHDLSEALREFGLSSVYAEVSVEEIGCCNERCEESMYPV